MRRVALLLMWCSIATAALPQRIVSLKPNITEIIFALGAGDRLVGVTSWCNFPAAAQRVPKIADYIRPNLEAIAALRPDLVIGSEENSQAAPIMQLRALKIPIMLLPFATIDDTLRSITTLGARIGATNTAQQLTTQLAHTLQPRTLTSPPRVLLLVGTKPLIAAGPASFVGELLARTGANNVITARAPAYPQIGTETVQTLHADIIVVVSSDSANALPTTTPITTIDPDLFRPGPRMDRAFLALQHAIQAR